MKRRQWSKIIPIMRLVRISVSVGPSSRRKKFIGILPAAAAFCLKSTCKETHSMLTDDSWSNKQTNKQHSNNNTRQIFTFDLGRNGLLDDNVLSPGASKDQVKFLQSLSQVMAFLHTIYVSFDNRQTILILNHNLCNVLEKL